MHDENSIHKQENMKGRNEYFTLNMCVCEYKRYIMLYKYIKECVMTMFKTKRKGLGRK